MDIPEVVCVLRNPPESECDMCFTTIVGETPLNGVRTVSAVWVGVCDSCLKEWLLETKRKYPSSYRRGRCSLHGMPNPKDEEMPPKS